MVVHKNKQQHVTAACVCPCRYILISLPGVWLDTVDRPMNRMLVAQSITAPQMWISGFGVLLATTCMAGLHRSLHCAALICVLRLKFLFRSFCYKPERPMKDAVCICSADSPLCHQLCPLQCAWLELPCSSRGFHALEVLLLHPAGCLHPLGRLRAPCVGNTILEGVFQLG